jgi:hypothetical protein
MLENGGEVCLEEVERRQRLGMAPEEIAREMGVDPSWVESLISSGEGEASAAREQDRHYLRPARRASSTGRGPLWR